MSHGDRVRRPPPGFAVCATTDSAPIVAVEDAERRLYGIQFHPEVSHTVSGGEILRNFLYGVCGAGGDWAMASFLEEAVEAVRERAPEGGLLCGLSGGVDSAVVAALLNRAVGDRLTAVFVDNGLLRKGEVQQVRHGLREELELPVRVAEAAPRFLAALAGVEDPEEKRRRIGHVFIEVFEEEAAQLEGVRYLAQGTLYPDVIESVSVKGPSAVIKTHHNVGGLPEELGFELIEPLRWLFKDEVRQLGRELGLPEEFIGRHPFPGPGLAVRILGEVTAERLAVLREADAIFLEELRRARLLRQGRPGLRGAAAGAQRRRDGRRPDLRERRRPARGRDPGLHDRRLEPAAARPAGRRRQPDRQRGRAASTGWSTTSPASRRRRSSGNEARRRRRSCRASSW